MFGLFSRRKRDEAQFARDLKEFLKADTQRRRLEQFDKVIEATGRTPPRGEGADIQTCGLIASLFAIAANDGQPLTPKERPTDWDIAVLWVGLIAVDMATQLTGTNYEIAGLVLPASVYDLSPAKQEGRSVGQITEQTMSAFFEMTEAHGRLSSLPQNQQLGSTVASAFFKWATVDEHQGLHLIQRRMTDLADTLRAYRNPLRA